MREGSCLWPLISITAQERLSHLCSFPNGFVELHTLLISPCGEISSVTPHPLAMSLLPPPHPIFVCPGKYTPEHQPTGDLHSSAKIVTNFEQVSPLIFPDLSLTSVERVLVVVFSR